MIRTFGWVAGRLEPLATSESLATASAGLPAGAYTTLRTYRGDRVLRLRQHAERLRQSVTAEGPGADLEEGQLRRAISAALRACGHPESRLRVTWAPPRLFVSVEPFEPLPESLYREGVACVTIRGHRDRPQAKHTGFIATAAAAYRRLPPGVHEGLLVDNDGAILEGLSSNFFAILPGERRTGVFRTGARTPLELRTEDARALPGVTRSLVLEVARRRLPITLAAIRRDVLPQASEAFITSVSRGVLPVVRIDGQAIGKGRPGPWTRAIMDDFAAMVEREAERI